MEGVSAAEMVLVLLPRLHPSFHRGHPSGFSLPIGASAFARVPCCCSPQGGGELVQSCLCLSPGRACKSFSQARGQVLN